MAYNPITQVSITLQTSGLTAQGFGTPLFIADVDIDTSPDPMGAGVRVKTYSTLEEVAGDWLTTDAAYIAASEFLSNSPSIPSFKIGYRDIGTAAETPAEAIAEIEAVDDDWYFLTAETHDTTLVLAYADAIEARTKLYFFSSGEAGTLAAYSEGVSTDTLAQVKEGNYFRTKGFFHHDADTTFPECSFVGYNAPYLAGSVSWSNLRLQGVSVSQDPSTGIPLSTAQKGYLEERNAAYTERLGANTVITRNGMTAFGEFIDNIRGRDSLESDINVELQDLLVRQKGSKLPYTNNGITQIMNVVENVLQRYSVAPRNFINPNYQLNFLMANEVPVLDKSNRVYQSGSFKAELQGAIERVVMTGTLVISLG